jgi:hypothetical protein
MGKTQIALQFAHQHTSTYPVILWLNSETEESMKQSFNSAATEWLTLPGAKANEDSENRLILLKWLQETGSLLFLSFLFSMFSLGIDNFTPYIWR